MSKRSAHITVLRLAVAAAVLCACAAPLSADLPERTTTSSQLVVGVTPNTLFDVICEMCTDTPGTVVSDGYGIVEFTVGIDAATSSYTICLGGGSPSPLQITGQFVCIVEDTSATVCWQTNRPATSQVAYGMTQAYGSLTAYDGGFRLDHEERIGGLTPGTTYHCRAISIDGLGNGAVTADMTFTTVPAQPQIYGVAVSDTTSTTATITWSTSSPATSQVLYGPTSSYGLATPIDDDLTSDHTVVLEDLEPDTPYHFRAVSVDAYGQQVSSQNGTFTTNEEGTSESLVVSEVAVGSVWPNKAMVRWLTNLPSSSIVEYGLNESYGSQVVDNALVTYHSAQITGLLGNRTYHFRVVSIDEYGSVAVSDDGTFETPPFELEVVGVVVTSVTQTSFAVDWTTNRPASSQIVYGTQEIYDSLTPRDDEFVTEHSVTVEGLLPATTYHFSAVSIDEYGAEVGSPDQTVTTAGEGPPDLQLFGVWVSETTATTATIAWGTNVPSTSVVEYGLTSDCPLEVAESVMVVDHNIVLTGLTSNTVYCFRVRSEDEQGNEELSSLGTFLTLNIEDFMPPSVPSDVTVDCDEGCVTLSWSASGDPDLDGYNLYKRHEGEADFYVEASLPSNATSYVDHDVVDGAVYTYAVAAVDDSGNESEFSEAVSGVPGTGGAGKLWIFPNPVREGTTIRFSPPEGGGTRDGSTRYVVNIYDAVGRLIRTVATGEVVANIETTYWDGTDSHGRRVASGIYFCVATCTTGSLRAKVMVLR